MAQTPNLPINFNSIRIALVQEVQKISGLTCVVSEPETQNVPRPPKPYFSLKLTTPAAKSGDDSKQNIGGTIWNSGGVRKMSVSFQCYGNTHEEAYNYMGLLQTSLDLSNIQEDLRRAGIAVWIIGNVADLSQLLNTGYEGRAQMDCTFGIAMNLVSDLGSIETVNVEGLVSTDSETIELNATVTIPE